MRIITGSAKGMKLKTPEGIETRPTTERVKEALFSMIQFDLENRRILDLFAGSGQLGLEALSRGAAFAVFVDRSRDSVRLIKENIEKTRLSEKSTVYQGDYSDYIRKSAGVAFDLVFLDPPYAQGLYQPAMHALMKNGLLKASSMIVCESSSQNLLAGDPFLEEHFDIQKQRQYGNSYLTIFSVKKEATP